MQLPVLALAFLLGQADGPAPTVEVRPASANVSIGERFRVTLEAHGPRGVSYEFPKNISNGNIEMTQAPALSATGESAVYETQLFALGKDAQIPAIDVPFVASDGTSGVVTTEPLALNPVSALDPTDKNPAPADYVPPQPVLVSRAFWIVNSIAVVLLLAALIALVRRLRAPKKLKDAIVTPPVSPEEEALTRLATLAQTAQSLDPKTFYIQLVQTLKQYLERRLEAPVLEMTSTEALGLVRANAWTSHHATQIRDLIGAADLVKFGGVSDASHADRHLQLVRDVVASVDRERRAREEQEALLERGRTSS